MLAARCCLLRPRACRSPLPQPIPPPTQILDTIDAEAEHRDAIAGGGGGGTGGAGGGICTSAAAAVGRGAPSLALGQFAVCDVRWAQSGWNHQPLVREVQAQQRMGGARQRTREALRAAAAAADAVAASAPPAAAAVSAAVAAPAPASASAAGGSVGGSKAAVVAFLKEQVTRWAPHEALSALGVDSLDTVQMRNAFMKAFGAPAPLSLFTASDQTLGRLVGGLSALLDG